MKKALLFLYAITASTVFTQDLGKARLRMNPLGWTPLSGLVVLDTTNSAPLTVRVKGRNGGSDIAYTYPSGWGTEFAVHGFYADFTNTLSIEMAGRKGAFPVYVAAQPPRLSFPIEVLANRLPPEDPFNHDLYFISIPLQGALIGIDRQGDVRYLNRKNIYSVPHIEARAQGMIYHDTPQNGDYVSADFLGNELSRFSGGRTHHEMMPIGGNKVLLSVSDWGWDDTLTEFSPQGAIVATKYFGDALRKAAAPQDMALLNRVVYDDKNIYQKDGTNMRTDWAHINGYTYDYETDTIILSVRSQGIFALRYKTWELLWWFANDDLKVIQGFGYGFAPPNSLRVLDIPSLQKYRLKNAPNIAPLTHHAPLLKANGNLMLFDNHGDSLDKTKGGPSRAVEYSIKNNTLSLVREFKHPRNLYSRLTCDVDLTGQNYENWLILHAETYPNYLTEIAPDNSILFDVVFHTKQLFWRVDKKPLYPYTDPHKKYSIDKNEAAGI